MNIFIEKKLQSNANPSWKPKEKTSKRLTLTWKDTYPKMLFWLTSLLLVPVTLDKKASTVFSLRQITDFTKSVE